jgi:hypothetical protein
MLMLENGDPRLESFTEELLKRGQQYRTNGIARGKVSHGLAAMGILSRPLRMRGYTGWKEKRTDGIAPEWVGWCQRWRETSVLRPEPVKQITALFYVSVCGFRETALIFVSPLTGLSAPVPVSLPHWEDECG